MTYTKQNFEDGQVLTAEHLNKMEEGIAAVSVFGEELGDTLTINQISESEVEALIPELVCEQFLKVCDSPVTIDDLANGFTVVIGEDVIEVPPEGVSEMVVPMADGVFHFGEVFLSVEEQGVGVDVEGMVFPESGLYAVIYAAVVGASLTIPNFGKMVGIVPLDAKYIPDTIARKADIVQPDWAQTDETAKDYIKNKPDSEVVILTGSVMDNRGRLLENNEIITNDRLKEICDSGKYVLIRHYGTSNYSAPTFISCGAGDIAYGYATAIVATQVDINSVSGTSHKVFYTAER